MQATRETISFKDSASISAKPEQFAAIEVSTRKALESWKLSMFSFEWLNKDGSIKDLKDLSAKEAQKRLLVEQKLENGEALEKPVLGIGIMDNIEIGAGRDVFLTLAAQGQHTIPVHIPKSAESDFKAFVI